MATYKYTHELCPHCEQEVKLTNKFIVQPCPTMDCKNCPLNSKK